MGMGKNVKTAQAKRLPLFVAIVGGSGAGKSWLSGKLLERFGEEAAVLCLDDFYRDRSHLPLSRRSRANFDHPRAIDWESFDEVLHQCQASDLIALPRYDFSAHARAAERKAWKPTPVILVEGLWLLLRPELRRLFAVKVFLQCDARLRLKRRLQRDVDSRGRTAAAVREQFKRQVNPMHRRFIETQARWADVVLPSPVVESDVDSLYARILKMGEIRQAGLFNPHSCGIQFSATENFLKISCRL